MNRLLFALVCGIAALVPLFKVNSSPIEGTEKTPPRWPAELQGHAVTALPLTEREQVFARGFPGRIRRFTDGQTQYILRWITRPTRRLHPAADCFRASGYRIEAAGLWRDKSGARWSRFVAKKGDSGTMLRVSEHIYDEAGNSWSDVSAWYWAASRSSSEGPWWALTVIESVAAPL